MSQNEKDKKFCSNCGQPLAGDSKFCSSCGKSTAPTAMPATPTAKKSKTPLIIAIIAVVVVVALLVSAFVWVFPFWGPGIVGSGNLVSEEMSLSDFSVVEVGSGFIVVITQSSSYSIKITANENVIDKVRVAQTVETLKVGLKPGIIPTATLKAEITMPDLYGVILYEGSHGTVKGFSSSHSLFLALSGGSHIEAEGAADDLSITASGGSHLDLSNFQVHNANVELDGGSHATINLDGRLDADLSGGSHLYYIGEPTPGKIQKSDDSEVRRR